METATPTAIGMTISGEVQLDGEVK